MSEHSEQVALFQWASMAQQRWPELRLMYAVPNGGFRTKATAGKLKAEGVRAGVPDITVPWPRGGFAALYVEMKYDKNKPTKIQLWWHDELRKAGNSVVTCWGWEDAKRAIEGYLSLGKVKSMVVEFQE